MLARQRNERRAVRRREGGDAGGSPLEFVIGFPLVLLMLMVIIQFAVFHHARHIAEAAAQEGARAARQNSGSSTSAETTARRYLDELGSDFVISAAVTVTHPDTQTVRVRIRGRAPQLVPFLRLRLDQSSQGAIEEFRSEP